MPIEKAIYMATYTPAKRMGLHDRGEIAPGKKADFLLLNDLESFDINTVYKSERSFLKKASPSIIQKKSKSFQPLINKPSNVKG